MYLGHTGAEICRVAATLKYITSRGPAGGPFFRFSDGCNLTWVRFMEEVRAVLHRAGVQSGEISGHSF